MAEYSYNGWVASRTAAGLPGGCVALVVAGESFAPGVRGGDVHTVLGYVAEQMHARVEPIYAPGWHEADDWGWFYRLNRNANNLSCHSSGTAIDYNATRHPNGRRGTFKAAQVAEIRKILAELRTPAGVPAVRWGGDFTGTPDEMHFEIRVLSNDLAVVAARIRTARTLTKEALMGAVDELLPGGNHYDGAPEQLGYAVREMEPRIVGRLTSALGDLEAKVLAKLADLPKLTVNELLNRQLTATTWNGGDVKDMSATVAALLTRASEGSIAAHVARGHKLIVASASTTGSSVTAGTSPTTAAVRS